MILRYIKKMEQVINGIFSFMPSETRLGKATKFFCIRYVLFFILSHCQIQFAYCQHQITDIPHPRHLDKGSYVSNPDQIITASTVVNLNGISTEIDSLTSAEYVITLVNNYSGENDFDFALELFNSWGVGKKASNNGLLLFIAKDRREFRFITGYGMERILPDAALKRIGEKYLVPYFKEENYDQGVLEVSSVIKQVLTSPDAKAELERLMPESISFWSLGNVYFKNTLVVIVFFTALYIWIHIALRLNRGKLRKKSSYFHPILSGCGCMGILMFITVFLFAFVWNNVHEVYQVKNIPYFILVLGSLIVAMKYTVSRTAIIDSYVDEENIQKSLRKFKAMTLIAVLFSPLALCDVFAMKKRSSKNAARFLAPDDSGNWERINKDGQNYTAKAYLDKGQRKEEEIESLHYEIWVNKIDKSIKAIPWEGAKSYAKCPKCNYTTYEEDKTDEIKAATYSSEGLEEDYDKCRFCGHRVSRGNRSIPKLVRSSSSGSGGRSSGGGGGSSSGGGSFGGGSSGGGGAGGRW